VSVNVRWDAEAMGCGRCVAIAEWDKPSAIEVGRKSNNSDNANWFATSNVEGRWSRVVTDGRSMSLNPGGALPAA